MVAEFMGRNQSGSPVNGELPHLTSNMPGSHCRDGMLSNTSSPSPDSYQGSYSAMSPHPHNGGKASSNGSAGSTKGELLPQRKQREFTPENKKDDSYWDRRRRNNEAAKRSREKRRFNDMILEQRVLELTKENTILKAQLETIKEEFGICGESVVNVEKVLATLPTNEQMLSVSKRQKISHGNQFFGGGSGHSPIPTPVIQQVVGLPGSPSPPPPMPTPSVHSVSGLQHQHSPPASLHDPAYRDMVDYPHHPYPSHSHNLSTYHQPIHHPHHPQHLPHHHVYGLHHPTASSLSHHNDDGDGDIDADGDGDGDNALNLTSRASRASRARQATQSPTTYEVSSNSGDESSTLAPLALTTNTNGHAQHNSEANNSLPLKLRHKQHPLGDKDAANTLLSLQHIKQEPGNSSRCSPPYDGEGSSDERDSGISLGSECPSQHPQPSIIPDISKAIRMRNEMRLEHQHQISPADVAYLRHVVVYQHRSKQHAKETPA